MKKTLEEMQATDYPSVKRRRMKKQLVKFHAGKALDIVTKVAEGKTLRSVCVVDKGYPSVTTFLRWVSEYPDLRNAFEAAKTMSAYVMEEEAIDLARSATEEKPNQNTLRALTLAIDQLRWSATRRDPKSYSDKGNQAVVVPIHISTPLDLGTGSFNAAGTAEHPDIYSLSAKLLEKSDVVDGEFTEVPKEAETPPPANGNALAEAVSAGIDTLPMVPLFDLDAQREELRRKVAEKHKVRMDRYKRLANATHERKRQERRAAEAAKQAEGIAETSEPTQPGDDE